MLAAAALAVELIPGIPTPPEGAVEQAVTVALILILFDGGRHIGWARLRPSLVPIIVLGVLGTFLTAAGGGVLLHVGFGLAWYVALLVATAVSPTDPAAVFSVLGRQQIAGRSGAIVIGQRRAPYQREIERFHAALAGLAEIVATDAAHQAGAMDTRRPASS
jgi:potassium/hydrogen antiporter